MKLSTKIYLMIGSIMVLLLCYSTYSLISGIIHSNELANTLPIHVGAFVLCIVGLCILAAAILKRHYSQYIEAIRSINQSMLSAESHRKLATFNAVDNDRPISFELQSLLANINDLQKRLSFSHRLGKQGWFEMEPKSNTIMVGEEYATLLGYQANELSTNLEVWQDQVHPEDRESVKDTFIQTLKSDQPIEMEFRIRNKSKEYIWMSSVCQTVKRDSRGKATRIIAVQTDISEHKINELREKVRVKVLKLLVDELPLKQILASILNILEQENHSIISSILLLDKEGKRLKTGAFCRLPTFYSEAIDGVIIGPNVGSCGTAAYTKERVIVEDIQSHPYWQNYKELASKANLASCWSEPIIGSEGKALGSFAIYHDTPRSPNKNDFKLIEFVSKLAAVAIERSLFGEQIQLYSRVFSDTHEAIIITDPKGSIIEVNPAFCIITGYSREEVIGKNPSFLSSGRHKKEFFQKMWRVILEQGHWQGEVWNLKKNGELYIELLSISSLNDEQGNTLNYVGLFSDITKTIKQQEELKLMAHYDMLTQLPNRTLFTDRFHQALAHSRRIKKKLAICFLDLDNFKPINDNFGHNVGDRLLIEVARRISKNVRSEDTVSRQGGDEFALLLGDIDDFELCSQSLQRILDSLAQPFLIEGKQHHVTASCGITLYPDDDADIDTLLRHADHAMYQAKITGKNCFQLFNPEKDQKTINKHHRLIEVEQALENDELCLYYQPKINMKTGEFFGVEALIRWNHPTKGLVPPLDFLPAIEGTSLEIKIGEWVIKAALEQLQEWNTQGLDLEVSVNISSHHLQSSEFLRYLSESLSSFPEIDSEKLQLEILESSVLGDIDLISETLRTCQESLGVNIALDDFGTGYSSLTHMRNLPTNTVKIDQSFVRDVLDDPSDYVIVDGVIGLAESFERMVIAEGVESTEHGLILLMMGCELAQGYEIAKPMPVEELITWQKNHTPNKTWLEWGKQQRSKKQNKLDLFRLTCGWWKNHFATNIMLSPELVRDWPIMDNRQCHCGRWLVRAIQDSLFDQSMLYQLDIFHRDIHSTADELRALYEAGNHQEARKGLSRIEVLFEEMDEVLKEYG